MECTTQVLVSDMVCTLLLFNFTAVLMLPQRLHVSSVTKVEISMQSFNSVVLFCMYCVYDYWWYQGHIEPPKAARGHGMYIDGKVLLNILFIYFQFHTCNDANTIAYRRNGWHPVCSIRLRRRFGMPAGNWRSLRYRRYFTAIENDRVGIHRAVVESGECFGDTWIWLTTPVSELSWLEETVSLHLDGVS